MISVLETMLLKLDCDQHISLGESLFLGTCCKSFGNPTYVNNRISLVSGWVKWIVFFFLNFVVSRYLPESMSLYIEILFLVGELFSFLSWSGLPKCGSYTPFTPLTNKLFFTRYYEKWSKLDIVTKGLSVVLWQEIPLLDSYFPSQPSEYFSIVFCYIIYSYVVLLSPFH